MSMSIREFLLVFYSLARSVLPTSDPPSSSTTVPEVQPVAAPVAVVEQNRGQFRLQWRNIVMTFCCSSALEIALLSAQIESQLPLCFSVLSLALLLTFLCLFVANLIGPHFTNTAQVLEKVAVVLIATAVVFAIAIPLPFSLKCITWALYAIALFTVLAIYSPAMSVLPTSAPQSSSTTVPEVQPAAAPVPVVEQNHGQFRLQWRNIVMTFCCSSALEIALLSAQIESQLPVCFYVLSLALLLTCLCLFLANLIGPTFTNTAQVLEKIAVTLVATTFVFTIAIPLPLSLKCITWALYAIALFTVLVCHYLRF